MNSVQGIAFDLEGTIIDVERLHQEAHLRAALDAGLALTWEEAFARLPHFIGGPDEEVASELAVQYQTGLSARDILLAKQTYFNSLLMKQDQLTPREGFEEYLRWAKSLGLEFCIGTVSDRELAFYLLKRAGLLSAFEPERIVAREDVLAPKPSPEVYLETAKRMGISPIHQLVFEDSPVGLTAARSAGCRLAAIPTIREPAFIETLRRVGAEAVFQSWKDPAMKVFVKKLLHS